MFNDEGMPRLRAATTWQAKSECRRHLRRLSSRASRWRRDRAHSVADASDDAGKFAHLILFELEIRRRPFLRQLGALLLNCRRRDFESRRKRHSQKFENPCGSIAVGSDNIFIKENERINLVFMEIISPAHFAGHYPVIQVINDVEIKSWNGTQLGLVACFLSPNTRLQCYSPRDCL